MSRRAWTWLGFAAVVGLLIAAVGALTVVALRADERERRERARAERAAEVRLALWRIDSALQPLLAREGARPPSYYLSSQVPQAPARHVLMHFDIPPDGRVMVVLPPGKKPADLMPLQPIELARILEAPTVTLANGADAEASSYNERVMNMAVANAEAAQLASVDASAGPMKPIWLRNQLYLVRRAQVGGEEHIQGALMDWPGLRAELETIVATTLPGARIHPAWTDEPLERRLAALPLILDPGPDPEPEPRGTTLLMMLGLAWAGVLAASGAGGALLAGTLRLSDRRAAFVAAVTHELRTPLTTLTTYSEMLADARMTDEAKRKSYLATMQREAGRLGALVDNVLAYSRIERGRPGLAADELSVASLVERIAPRLRDRAAAANMELVVTSPLEAPASSLEAPSSALPLPAKRGEGRGGGPDRHVVADEVAVDQILFNLVDNACKHAATAENRRIDLLITSTATAVTFTVRDHGPGIPDADRRQIFAPFRRAKSTSGPGVGLGLSLCRRLARHMRGDLQLDPAPTAGGASFTLTLPSA